MRSSSFRGRGQPEKNVSPNLVSAVQLARQVGASILGLVGRDGGYTQRKRRLRHHPTVNPEHVTRTRKRSSGVWHLFVSHPKLKIHRTKWEGTK